MRVSGPVLYVYYLRFYRLPRPEKVRCGDQYLNVPAGIISRSGQPYLFCRTLTINLKTEFNLIDKSSS